MHVRGGLHYWPRVVTQHSALRYSYRGRVHLAPSWASRCLLLPADSDAPLIAFQGQERATCRRRCHAVTLGGGKAAKRPFSVRFLVMLPCSFPWQEVCLRR